MTYERWQDLVVIGAEDRVCELHAYVQELLRNGRMIHVLGVIDDDRPRGPWLGMEILGGLADLRGRLDRDPEAPHHYLVSWAESRRRAEAVARLEALGAANLQPWTLRHPRAWIGQGVEIGAGSWIGPGAILTANLRVGRHCVIDTNASVSHHAEIGDFCTLHPGAVLGPGVRLGAGCEIGAGATVANGTVLGDGVRVAAGETVRKNDE